MMKDYLEVAGYAYYTPACAELVRRSQRLQIDWSIDWSSPEEVASLSNRIAMVERSREKSAQAHALSPYGKYDTRLDFSHPECDSPEEAEEK